MPHPIKVVYLAIALAPGKSLPEAVMDTLSDMRDEGHFIDWAIANRSLALDSAHEVDGDSPAMLALFESACVSPNTHKDATPAPLKWFAFAVDLVRSRNDRVAQSGTVYVRENSLNRARSKAYEHAHDTWAEASEDQCDYQIDARKLRDPDETHPRFNRPESVFTEDAS